MDIKCEKCHTIYEFDDNRVTEEGVMVKCSNCGRLFKVRKKSFVLTESVRPDESPPPESEKLWKVRRVDGTVLTFRELTTLQKWIVERSISRDDEISKSGETWKRLGAIAELSPFFQVVDQASAQAEIGAPAAPMSAQAEQPLGKPAAQAPAFQAPSAFQRTPPPAFHAEPDSWDDAASEPLEDDVVEKWKRRGRRKWYFIVPVLLLGVLAGVFYLAKPAAFLTLVQSLTSSIKPESAIPESARAALERGIEQLSRGSANALVVAERELLSADQAAPGRLPEVQGFLAEVHLIRAEQAKERIELLQDALQNLGPDKGREDSLKKEIADLTAAAESSLKAAAERIAAAQKVAPDATSVQLAQADLLRLKDDRKGLDSALRRALSRVKDDPWLLYVEGVSLGTDPNALDLAALRLQRVLELQPAPDFVRARYALARVFLRQKRVDDAKRELKRILSEVPDHETARALLESLAPPPAPPSASPSASPSAPSQQALAAVEPPKAERTFKEWLQEAERLRQSGRTVLALRAFETALSQKRGDVEALTGRGLCLLDLGKNDAAIENFQAALAANSRYGDALIGLAEAYKYGRDNENAIKYYKRYLELHPDGPEASVARSNLEQLKKRPRTQKTTEGESDVTPEADEQ